jgi:hypothetical protein
LLEPDVVLSGRDDDLPSLILMNLTEVLWVTSSNAKNNEIYDAKRTSRLHRTPANNRLRAMEPERQPTALVLKEVGRPASRLGSAHRKGGEG